MTKSDAIKAPATDALLKFMETEWRDIHHSRIQEWTSLGSIAAMHVVLVQMPRFLTESGSNELVGRAGITGCILGLMFSILGTLVTLRHRNLMRIKLIWIYEAELRLGLVKTEENPLGIIPETAKFPKELLWSNLSFPRLLSTSGMIFNMYILFMIFDISYLILLL